MNVYGVVVLVTLLVAYLLDLTAQLLNLRALNLELPPALADTYDADAYRRSQQYTRTRARLGLVAASYDLALLLGFWFAGGFGGLDRAVRMLDWPLLPTGLLYIGALALGKAIADLPFAAYATFIIEERYGFNRTTLRTFVTDLLKALGLAAAIGGPLLAVLLELFAVAGDRAWVYCWVVAALFTVAVQLVVPTWIMPLFNRFTPLAAGELRSAIFAYAERVGFPLDGIFVVDGSRRSTKSNAFFTGLGRRKRIALFDTLIAKHPVAELVAVLAHEVGHYRRRHVRKGLLLALAHLGVLLFLLQLFLSHHGLYTAFAVAEPSIYTGFVLFALLYVPVELLLALVLNLISRRHELEADRFAAETADGAALAAALKRLSVDHLANLTPHPLYVFLAYSHPPLLARLRALGAG